MQISNGNAEAAITNRGVVVFPQQKKVLSKHKFSLIRHKEKLIIVVFASRNCMILFD